MNTVEMYLKYGEAKGKLDAIYRYCKSSTYVDKDVIESIIGNLKEDIFYEQLNMANLDNIKSETAVAHEGAWF